MNSENTRRGFDQHGGYGVFEPQAMDEMLYDAKTRYPICRFLPETLSGRHIKNVTVEELHAVKDLVLLRIAIHIQRTALQPDICGEKDYRYQTIGEVSKKQMQEPEEGVCCAECGTDLVLAGKSCELSKS